jgi:ribonuclease P protein component
MLPKKNRADKKAVERIFKEGRFIDSPNLTFKFILIHGNERRVSVVVPKKVAKLAVKRNLLRRRGYVVLDKYIDQFPVGLIGIFVFKKFQDSISIIEDEIKNILNKIN